jgi:hypothetical protein
MNVELSKKDLELIDMLLSKEEGMTHVEIHHCFSHDYKNFLKEREKTHWRSSNPHKECVGYHQGIIRIWTEAEKGDA